MIRLSYECWVHTQCVVLSTFRRQYLQSLHRTTSTTSMFDLLLMFSILFFLSLLVSCPRPPFHNVLGGLPFFGLPLLALPLLEHAREGLEVQGFVLGIAVEPLVLFARPGQRTADAANAGKALVVQTAVGTFAISSRNSHTSSSVQSTMGLTMAFCVL